MAIPYESKPAPLPYTLTEYSGEHPAEKQRPSMGMVAERADQLFRELSGLSEQLSTVHNRIGACHPPADTAKSQANLNADNPIDAALSALQGATHIVNEIHNMAIRINERI